jgi:hypothetical protein
MNKIYCFGDSWGAGAELNAGEHPFVHWTASTLNLPYENLSREGDSLGMILHTIVSSITKIDSDDIVLVIIPPDTRWYDENKEQGFYTLMNWQRDDYFKFLNSKTLEWFKYHHAVFIYTIQKILDDIGCYYILAHNYGQIAETKKYNLSIDYNKFLSNTDLTSLLSGRTSPWKSYADHVPVEHRYDQDGPDGQNFTGIYFEGCYQHPNELGHQRIAELLIEKYHSMLADK